MAEEVSKMTLDFYIKDDLYLKSPLYNLKCDLNFF